MRVFLCPIGNLCSYIGRPRCSAAILGPGPSGFAAPLPFAFPNIGLCSSVWLRATMIGLSDLLCVRERHIIVAR
jgi:hypothetical protein